MKSRIVTIPVLALLFACSAILVAEEKDPFEELIEDEESKDEDFDRLKHSLFFEAEEMSGVDSNAYSATAAWKFNPTTPNETSRKCCLNAQLKPISQKIRIPKEETYQLWVRYRLATGKQAPFVVRVLQKGKIVFQHRYYGFRITKSGMAQEFQNEYNLWFDIPGMQEGVFSGEEWTWERASSKLPAGEATLIIEPQRRSSKSSLMLDAVLLTASKTYRPKFSDFREVWVRYRPVEIEPRNAEYKVDVDVQWLRPVMLHGTIQISAPTGQLTGPKKQPLRMGETSGWTELYDELKYGAGYCTTTFVPYRVKNIKKVVAEIDVAWGPREGQIIQTFREIADIGSGIGFAMPTERARGKENVIGSVWTKQFKETFKSFTDLSRVRNERIKKLIPEPIGVSRYFNFCTGVSVPGSSYASSEIFRLELESVSRMGINTLYGHSVGWVKRVGMQDHFPKRYYTAGASPARYWVLHTCPNHPNNPKAADAKMRKWSESLRKSTGDPDAGAGVFGMKIGDEIGVSVDEDHLDTCEDCQHRFVRFMKAEKFDPSAYGHSWKDVRWTARNEADDPFRRLLFYYSSRFLSVNTATIHAELVQAAHRHIHPELPVLYNVNPTPVMGGMSGHSLDWFEMERYRGMHSQWMEVIGKPEPGRSSFLADLAWGITSRRNLSIGCYNLYVSPKRSARDTLAFIARGAKSFIYYNYGPRTLGAADNFSESDDAIKAVAEATRPVVAAEEFLHNATRPEREVVMIYSRTAEIWGEDNSVIGDRIFTYLALNHDQIPMDIISEQDVLEGRLDGYRVGYLNGTHLRRDVALKVRDWVEQGGSLWGSIGTGMRDESDQRMDVLESVFGAKQKFVERKYPVFNASPETKTPDAGLGMVKWDAGPWGKACEAPCILQRAIVEPKNAKVVARFDDGLPAALTHSFGKGRSMLLAYSFGLTYSRFYRADKREQRYDEADRKTASQFALDTGVKRPVRVSKAGVEVTRLNSKKGIAVTLIAQFNDAPYVTVEFDLEKKPVSVKSVKSGALEFQHRDGKLSFDLNFENLDIVTIE